MSQQSYRISILPNGQRRYISLIRRTPLNSRGEVMIANFLDLRCELDRWTYSHTETRTLRDPLTKQEEQLIPDFVVQVPYEVGDETFQETFVIEFWGLAGEEGYDARRQVKDAVTVQLGQTL